MFRFFIIGSILGLAILAGMEYVQPWQPVRIPTDAQHVAAVAAGWIPGTDGYFRFIYGPDAY